MHWIRTVAMSAGVLILVGGGAWCQMLFLLPYLAGTPAIVEFMKQHPEISQKTAIEILNEFEHMDQQTLMAVSTLDANEICNYVNCRSTAPQRVKQLSAISLNEIQKNEQKWIYRMQTGISVISTIIALCSLIISVLAFKRAKPDPVLGNRRARFAR